MQRLIPTLALLAAMVFAPMVFAPMVEARQDDGRLDALFARLVLTGNPSEAAAIEVVIWGIWIAAEDDELDRLMAAGIGAMSTGRFGQALDSFNAVIEADPGFAEGWNKRATLYFLMGRYDDSIADVVRTLALEPRHFGALSGMGLIYSELDDADAALAWFEQAIEVNPHMPAIELRVAILRKILLGEPI